MSYTHPASMEDPRWSPRGPLPPRPAPAQNLMRPPFSANPATSAAPLATASSSPAAAAPLASPSSPSPSFPPSDPSPAESARPSPLGVFQPFMDQASAVQTTGITAPAPSGPVPGAAQAPQPSPGPTSRHGRSATPGHAPAPESLAPRPPRATHGVMRSAGSPPPDPYSESAAPDTWGPERTAAIPQTRAFSSASAPQQRLDQIYQSYFNNPRESQRLKDNRIVFPTGSTGFLNSMTAAQASPAAPGAPPGQSAIPAYDEHSEAGGTMLQHDYIVDAMNQAVLRAMSGDLSPVGASRLEPQSPHWLHALSPPGTSSAQGGVAGAITPGTPVKGADGRLYVPLTLQMADTRGASGPGTEARPGGPAAPPVSAFYNIKVLIPADGVPWDGLPTFSSRA